VPRETLMEEKGLSKRDKRIERWRNNPKDAVSRSITVVKSHPLKPIYVKRALALIDEIKEAIADGDI